MLLQTTGRNEHVTTDYDPFAGWSPNREVHQRLNQIASVIGAPAILDTAEIDLMAEEAANAAFLKLSDLDTLPMAQAVAAEMIQAASCPTEFDASDIRTDTRWADESATYRALIRDVNLNLPVWVPLSNPCHWRQVADAYADPEQKCAAHNHPLCEFYDTDTVWSDLASYAIKRGEIICIVLMCGVCRGRLNNRDWYSESYIQHGAFPWHDDGRRWFNDDEWDRK